MGLFSSGLSRNTKWEFSARGRVFTFPAVADVNGDGILEVVFGSDDHFIYALRGSDGSVAWSFETDGPVRSSPTVGDINGDGVVDIVVGSDDSNVYGLSGVDGRVLWAVRCDGPIRSKPAIGDVDCDGRVEVVVSGDDASIYAIDGATGELAWQSSHKGSKSGAIIQSAPCLADLDGDGKLEVVTGSASNYLLIFDSDGSLRMRKQFEAPSFNTSVAAGDVNGDGKVEIVACSDNGAVYVITPNGDTLWSRVVGVGTRSSPVICDLNDDGKMEILLHVNPGPGDDGRLVCLGFEGDILWEKTLRGQGGPTPIPVDLDHDGGIEIAAFSERNGIIILGPDGSEKKTIGVRGDVTSGPAIADVDGNGVIDFIYASTDGKIMCLGSHFGGRQNQVLNGGARSDVRNTACFRTVIQEIADLKRNMQELKSMGGTPGPTYQRLLKAEREQGVQDISSDLDDVRKSLSLERASLSQEKQRGESLARIKEKLKVFSSLDVDGTSQLSLAVVRIESLLAQGKDVDRDLEAAEEMVEVLGEKSKEKVQALNAKRLSFLVGQFLEKFPDPTDADLEGFIQYLKSERLPFLPYEIKKAIEARKQEAKFQSLRDSGRFDFMSEEDKVITIGSSLMESIIHDINKSMGVPMAKIQRCMDEVSADYANVPRLVLADQGKVLTDELRKTLRDISPEKVISAAVSLFCLYITKLFDFYQELTDFETSYSRFKTNMEYLIQTFGAEEIVSQFQERTCHGIFAEEVRVKRILDL